MNIQPITQNTAATYANPVAPSSQVTPAKTAASSGLKTDTVTLSKQAVLMNSPGYSPVEEASESSADRAAEKVKGQR